VNAPNFSAVLRDINADREDAAAKITRRLAQWSADVDRAVAVCSEDCDPAVHFAAQAIKNIPHQLGEHETVVLLGAVFRAIHSGGNLHMQHRQDALACISDAVDELLGEVVRQREDAVEAARGKRVVVL
jgi:hypothetical protein